MNFDLNLCWDKGVLLRCVGCWFPGSRSVTVSRAVTTTKAVAEQGTQGGLGSPIPSTIGQKALGELQKILHSWVAPGAGHPGGFPTDEINLHLGEISG